jgi:hypothetical protein
VPAGIAARASGRVREREREQWLGFEWQLSSADWFFEITRDLIGDLFRAKTRALQKCINQSQL